MLSQTHSFATLHELWRPETRVLVALSGGSDSVALLVLLRDLADLGQLRLDAAVHVHHGIREEADADASFCQALAERLHVPLVIERVDVPARARQTGQSLALAGRKVRQDVLETVMRARGADVIATAHTQDDQAETVLLRLLRGSGGRGAGGIAPQRQPYIRPLLALSHAELRAELTRRGEAWREDASNADLSHPRNRVRHELLPWLERHLNPRARQSLARFAAAARADDQWLTQQAAAVLPAVVDVGPGHLRMDAAALRELPEALAGRVVIHALQTVRASPAPKAAEVERVLDTLRGRKGAHTLAGVRVEPLRDSVVLIREGTPLAEAETAARVDSDAGTPTCRLRIPGEVRVEWANVSVVAEGPCHWPDRGSTPPEPWRQDAEMVCISADEVGGELNVRKRANGDRLQPLGLHGQKKLQDLLVDRKVPRLARDRVPVVTDATGRIVWVVGHAIAERVRVTARTMSVVVLKLRRI